jgi:hypothetical protein
MHFHGPNGLSDRPGRAPLRALKSQPGMGVDGSARVRVNILICDECDTIWLDRSFVSFDNGEGFGSYMWKQALPGLWTQ